MKGSNMVWPPWMEGAEEEVNGISCQSPSLTWKNTGCYILNVQPAAAAEIWNSIQVTTVKWCGWEMGGGDGSHAGNLSEGLT